MSEPMYAYRIWRIVPGNANGREPILTSASNVGPVLLRDREYPVWKTKTLTASCQWNERLAAQIGWQKRHPAPELDCQCGIYAYQDLLDGLRLIQRYCDDSMYAFGLVSGYGGVHRDGSVIAHDACMRFAKADIVAFAKIGSAWRDGLLGEIANRIGVPVMSLDELEAIAVTGQKTARRENRPPGTRYLDEIPAGETVSVDASALMVDQNGELFLRNDREAWDQKRKSGPIPRLLVTPQTDRRFDVRFERCPPRGYEFPLLPFLGEADLASPKSRLAGRVSSIDTRSRYPGDIVLRAVAAGSGAVRVPKEYQVTFLDLMSSEARVELSPRCVTFGIDGRAWLRRVLFAGKAEDGPNYFLTRPSELELRLEIETVVGQRKSGYMWPIVRGGTFTHDAAATQLTFNGTALPDARIPRDWMKRRNINFGLAY